jgi:hypothetical protein
MSEAATTETRAKRVKQRSPSYPAIDLKTALDKAQVIRQREGRHPAPVKTIIGHFGYGPKSSAGQLAFAALKKYGLLDESISGQTRMAKLSELALRILLDPREDSLERWSAIREAAKRPVIHAELLAKYGTDLPSDENLKAYLLLERKFGENAVEDFIGQYKRTISFARLGDDATFSGENQEQEHPMETPAQERGSRAMPTPPARTDVRRLSMPMSRGRTLVIEAPVPMSEAEVEALEATLKAWKTLLTEPPEAS